MSILDDIINAIAKKKITRLQEELLKVQKENAKLRTENAELRIKLRKYGFTLGPLTWK